MTDNELIAEFMGGTPGTGECEDLWYFGNPDQPKKYLRYDSSWDWLMPVVEKINESCKDTGYPDGLEICDWHVIAVANNIKLVYFSVVEFIKWYNENK